MMLMERQQLMLFLQSKNKKQLTIEKRIKLKKIPQAQKIHDFFLKASRHYHDYRMKYYED
jgi:hypothetical protein